MIGSGFFKLSEDVNFVFMQPVRYPGEGSRSNFSPSELSFQMYDRKGQQDGSKKVGSTVRYTVRPKGQSYVCINSSHTGLATDSQNGGGKANATACRKSTQDDAKGKGPKESFVCEKKEAGPIGVQNYRVGQRKKKSNFLYENPAGQNFLIVVLKRRILNPQ
eukprot:GHVP01068194.1.p1 GENE.GHVP01068194.1~~GHVP01068194.1.p1  ORF type:complete len:162 (-),score=7.52 GHVP01068194.1:14-499(-)